MAETAPAANNKSVVYKRKVTREMPLAEGSSPKTVSKNIAELHEGGTYARTKKKFGTKKANKQAVAIALNQARKSRKGKAKSAISRGLISEKAAKRHLKGY